MRVSVCECVEMEGKKQKGATQDWPLRHMHAALGYAHGSCSPTHIGLGLMIRLRCGPNMGRGRKGNAQQGAGECLCKVAVVQHARKEVMTSSGLLSQPCVMWAVQHTFCNVAFSSSEVRAHTCTAKPKKKKNEKNK